MTRRDLEMHSHLRTVLSVVYMVAVSPRFKYIECCLSQLLQLRLEEEEEEEKEKEEEVELVVRLERHEDPRAEQD